MKYLATKPTARLFNSARNFMRVVNVKNNVIIIIQLRFAASLYYAESEQFNLSEIVYFMHGIHTVICY